MDNVPIITADQVRAALLARIDEHIGRSGISASALGKAAVNDDRLVARIRAGGNFTIEMYQRVIDWLEQQDEGAAA